MLGVFKKKLKPKRQSRRTKATNLQAVAPNSLDIPQTDNGAGSSKKPLENEDRINHDTLSENTCYPLSPNICVEGGRIEFIKIPQTDLQIENYEEKLKNLEQLLAEERLKNEVERLAISKLQRQNAKLETQVKNLEQDKSQTEEMYIKDEEKMKATILMLQNDCRKLEEGVRTLLPYKSHADQLKSEKMSISLAYEGKLQQYHLKLTSLLADNEAFKQKVQAYESKEAGYEACLDQVASQVVKALISQKALKEEIATLRARIRDLEQQNLSLTSLICCQHQHQAKTPSESCKSAAEACPGLHTRPQNLNLNGKVAECLVSNGVEPTESSSHLNSELVAVKLGQFNARLNSLVSAKICDHVKQVNTKQQTKSECLLEEYQLIDKHEDTRRSVSCEPSAPDLSCLSPEKRRTDITPESLFTNLPPETTNSTQCTPKHTEICKVTTPNGTKFPECNLIEMTDSELAKISFCEIPAKDEGYNTLTSEILPDFDTSLHTDITRLLPDLAEESEASFEFSKIQPLRHSYPPLNTKIKFQHLLNYFSDSQLFLRFPDLNPGSVIRFSDFWDYEPGFDVDSSHSNFEFGGSESLWNIEELMKSERPLSLTPSITPSTTSSDSDHSNSLSDGPHENSSNVDFTNDYYCLVKVGSVKSLASSPQIQSECSVVLCELTLEEKSHLPQECMPLLIDTDDRSDSLNVESIEDCTLNQIEENKDEEEDELDLLDHLSDSPSPSTNESDSNKSSSDLDLSPSELEFFTVTDLKQQKRYKTRNYFTTDYPGRLETSNLQRRGKSKSESQLNTHKTINKKRPNSECFHNKSQYSIHKSYYNNFVKFSPKKSSISNEELKIPCTSSKVQNENDILEIVKDNLKLNSLDKLKTTATMQIAQKNISEEACSSSNTEITEISACCEETQVEQTSDNIKLLLQNDVLDFDCMKSDGADFTSDSKKIIETLNRMIQKSSNSSEEQLNRNSIEFKEGIPTSWVHFEKQTNFSDPKERANLLDQMLATAPSSEESENDDFKDYQHLLKLHRRRRHRKAYMHHRGFLRSAAGCSRASIVGQRGLFTRYSEAEKQAVASFDFLFELDDNELLEEEE